MAVGFLFLVLHKESDFFQSFLFGLPGISERSSRYWSREHRMLCSTAQYTKVYYGIGPSSRVVREAALGRRGWGGRPNRTAPITNRHDSLWFELSRSHFALFWSFGLAISGPGWTSRGGKKKPLGANLESGLNQRDRATGGFCRNYTHRKPSNFFYCRGFAATCVHASVSTNPGRATIRHLRLLCRGVVCGVPRYKQKTS